LLRDFLEQFCCFGGRDDGKVTDGYRRRRSFPDAQFYAGSLFLDVGAARTKPLIIKPGASEAALSVLEGPSLVTSTSTGKGRGARF
jgi:hypothetical protein